MFILIRINILFHNSLIPVRNYKIIPKIATSKYSKYMVYLLMQ